MQAAAQGMNGNAAGAFYFRVSDPLVEAEDVKSAAEAAIAKTLQLKGVVLSEVDVINARTEASNKQRTLLRQINAVRKELGMAAKDVDVGVVVMARA